MAQCQWLAEGGIFLDLEDIGAGERWKDALRKANARCEAVLLLASPDALDSPECLAEVRKAEDFGKEIIVVLMRDVQFEDRRLDGYKDRQIVDMCAPPQSHVETVQYRGNQYEVRFNDVALASVKEYLFKRGITPDHFAWPPARSPQRRSVSRAERLYRRRCRHLSSAAILISSRARQAAALAPQWPSKAVGHSVRLRRGKIILSARRPVAKDFAQFGFRTNRDPAPGTRHPDRAARGWGVNWRCNCPAPAPRSMLATFTRNSWRKMPRKPPSISSSSSRGWRLGHWNSAASATQKRAAGPHSRGRSGRGAVAAEDAAESQRFVLLLAT